MKVHFLGVHRARDMTIRWPHDGELVLVCPDKAAIEDVTVFIDSDGEYQRLEPERVAVTRMVRPDQVRDVTTFLTTSIDRTLFLWPVERPVPDDHPIHQAMKRWLNIYRKH